MRDSAGFGIDRDEPAAVTPDAVRTPPVIANCAVCRTHFESDRHIEQPGEPPLLCAECIDWQRLMATQQAYAQAVRHTPVPAIRRCR